MADGTSALAARRREKPNSNRAWQAVSSSSTSMQRQVLRNNENLGATPRISWLGSRPSVVGGAAKRGFDIVAAATAILLLVPLFCLIAVAI